MSKCSSGSQRGTIPVGDDADLEALVCKMRCCSSDVSSLVYGEAVLLAKETVRELWKFLRTNPEVARDPNFIDEVRCLNSVINDLASALPDDLVRSMEELAEACGCTP